VAGCIGILNTQNKLAACVASIQPAKQGCAKASNMLETSWTGSEAKAWCPVGDAAALVAVRLSIWVMKTLNLFGTLTTFRSIVT